jgi:transketolase
MTTGSLGQGLSAAVGIALALKLDKRDSHVYAIIGDGESQEGQNWEAAMSAAHFHVDNLVAFTDFNKMQIDGMTDDVMKIEHLEKKWRAFGWHTQQIDGHNFAAIDAAVELAHAEKKRPSMIILNTIKGKGCCFAENEVGSHNMPVTKEQLEQAIAALQSKER